MENSDNFKLERDSELKKIKEDLVKNLVDYQTTVRMMGSDAPISILCLPKVIEKALLNQGWLRVYDLLNRDFIKVEGLNESKIRDLTSRLDQFLSMF